VGSREVPWGTVRTKMSTEKRKGSLQRKTGGEEEDKGLKQGDTSLQPLIPVQTVYKKRGRKENKKKKRSPVYTGLRGKPRQKIGTKHSSVSPAKNPECSGNRKA